MNSGPLPPAIPDHELLRVVGRGSYGEVWLARNVMGVPRAVKVVRRDRFDSERPYDREFKGIERYEPLSRTSDGLVQVLHVGRNDREGFFYYVMELADDAAGTLGRPDDAAESATSSYVPRTLRLDLGRTHRLPIGECVEIGRSLATGLGQLHRNLLVHRDLKPSNIVFVNGRAKLADLGLVARLDESRSFVGTEGFVPPEGPGKPPADLFALGRVLYQASTGLDPTRFPEIPEDWIESPDAGAAMEFLEVVLKLGESDVARRYQEATEVLADLAVIQSGRSVRELRALGRRVRFFRTVGVALGLGLLISGLVGAWARREARREHENFVRVAAAERSMRSSLVEARIEQARAMRWTGGIGSRDESLRVLGEAMAAEPSAGQRLRVRSEAAAALAQLGSRWVPAPSHARSLDAMAVALDPKQEWVARHEADGSLVVRSLADGREHGRLPSVQPPDDEVCGFSPSRRFVVLRRGREYLVGDLQAGRFCRTNGPCGFAANDELWVGTVDGHLQRVRLPEGEVTRDLGPSPRESSVDEPWSHIVPAPVGNRVLTCRAGATVLLWDTESGVVSEVLQAPDEVYSAAWDAGARQLAVGTVSGEVRVWELPDPEPHRTFSVHATAIRRVAFDPAGRILAAAVEGETLKLLDTGSGREIAELAALVWNLSFRPSDGRLSLVWRGGEPGYIELLPPRAVTRYARARGAIGDGAMAYASDGGFIAVGTSSGLDVLDVAAGGWRSPRSRGDVRAVAFDGLRGRLAWLDDLGLAWIPWSTAAAALDAPPRREPGRDWTHFSVGVSRPATLLAHGGEQTLHFQMPGSEPVILPAGQFIRFTAVSPDGRLGASGNLNGRDIQLWDLVNGRVGKRVPSGLHVRPLFSPDGRWLAALGPTCTLWEAAKATPGPALPGGPANTVASSAAFRPDGRRLAVVYGDREVHVFELPGATPDITLEAPSRARVVALAYSPSGDRLAVATVEGDVFLWDLGQLDVVLAEHGLVP